MLLCKMLLLLLHFAYVSVIVCNVVVSKSCHLLWCKFYCAQCCCVCHYNIIIMLLLVKLPLGVHVTYVSVIVCNVAVSKSCHYAVV